MMRLKVAKLGEGLHPSEAVVSVQTKDGPVVMVVDQTIISDETVGVGWPVDRDAQHDLLLVELPRETEHGSWRVWVPKSELHPDDRRKRA